jgi:hypothetical protein
MPLTGRRGQTLIAITAILCVVAFASFALASWSFYNGHRAACDARDANLDVTRDILITSQGATPRERQLRRALETPEQRRRSAAFYGAAFKRINEARC